MLPSLFDSENLCGAIRDMGFEYVELSLTGALDEAAVLESCERIWTEGLLVDLHPYPKGLHNCAFFERDPDNRCMRLTERYLAIALEVAERQSAPTVLNFHPAEITSRTPPFLGERRELVARSKAFFGWIDELLNESGRRVLVTSELQCPPPAGEPDIALIGDTQEESVHVAEDRRNPRAICWDTGHGYLAHLRRSDPLIPPPEFARRVGHIHLHDVDGERDHVPIGHGQAPIREYCQLLASNGFDGDVTVELHHRVCHERGFGAQDIYQSLVRTRDYLAHGGAA